MNAHANVYNGLTEMQRATLGQGLIMIKWNSLYERVEVVCGLNIQVVGDCSLMDPLGFKGHTLQALRTNIAEGDMQFYLNNIIRVNCYDVRGGYENDERGKTIYEFDCLRHPGERYEEKPNFVTYFPVSDRTSLREV